MLTSKEVAEMFNIPVSTIRYYEKIGIIPPIERDEKGYRMYTDAVLNRIYLMKSLRSAGLSIESLVEYVRLGQSQNDERRQQKELLQGQLHEMDQKIAEMQQVRKLLAYKIENYDKHLAKFESRKQTDEPIEKLWQVKL